MKKSLLLASVIAALALVACEKKEEAPAAASEASAPAADASAAAPAASEAASK